MRWLLGAIFIGLLFASARFACVKTDVQEVTPWLRVTVKRMRFNYPHAFDSGPPTVFLERRSGSAWKEQEYSSLVVAPFADRRAVIVHDAAAGLSTIVRDDGSSSALPSWLCEATPVVAANGSEVVCATCWTTDPPTEACRSERLTRFERTGDAVETLDVPLPPACQFRQLLFDGSRVLAGLHCNGVCRVVDAKTGAETGHFPGYCWSDLDELAKRKLSLPAPHFDFP